MRDHRKRLFFVVYANGIEKSIFETLEEADDHARNIHRLNERPAIIRVAIVQNAYKGEDGWHLDDSANLSSYIHNL